ncbi:hypothetical protein KHA80_18555 [Anaerobacillus sp. HL2]|nr:hypothetical protein KHA80_18555 [Anaerobacillus sp. HL2]
MPKKVQRVLKEEFNRDISLTFLDGTPSDALFEYSSLYLDELYKPKETLDPFIKALSEKLLKIGEI